MPRCEKCHSQWATYFRCAHCNRSFPCPVQLLLVSLVPLAAVVVGLILFYSFRQKIADWQEVSHRQDAEAKAHAAQPWTP